MLKRRDENSMSNSVRNLEMTDEQIEQIEQMVKEYFTEEWCEEGGYGWTEFSGKPDAFLKFARAMYDKGQEEEIRRQKTGIGYVNGVLFMDEF